MATRTNAKINWICSVILKTQKEWALSIGMDGLYASNFNDSNWSTVLFAHNIFFDNHKKLNSSNNLNEKDSLPAELPGKPYVIIQYIL